jgi:hypothetical protein
MALLDSLGTYLQTQGVGTLATNIFLGRMPDTPDACVVLIEDTGNGPMHVLGASAYAIQRPRVRAFTRAARNDYPAARTKAEAVRTALGAIRDTTLSGVTFLCVNTTSDLYPVMRDGDDRVMIGIDFVAWVA